jgi:hypothetical protein
VSTADDRPLDAADVARLMAPFEPFEGAPAVAVAVSGGRDSLALALLAQEWAAARSGRIVGLIVDHALRPESAEEAATTVSLLGRHECEAEILRWSEAKPRTGLQEAARTARYRLLREACRRRGILHLLVAHHADDQAETVAMPGKAGPMALPACRRRSSCRRCGCCGRCSGLPDRASPRRCSPVACRGSTILPTAIRALSGQGCVRAIG